MAIVIAAIVLYGFHRVALWMERKGWIFYRDRKPSPGSLGNALLEVQKLIEPPKTNILEVRLAEDEESDEYGEPPEI